MAVNSERSVDLYGRHTECRTLSERINDTRRGRGGALVICGERGVGKTALVEFAVAAASDLRVIRMGGTESERAVPYGGLHRLSHLLPGHLARLPAAQSAALEAGFGERTGPPPHPLLVGLAALGLLTEGARGGALLCVIDDLHWLDQESARAMVFAARRITSEPVSVIVTARCMGPELSGLPELTVGGLRDQDARELFASLVRWPLDERVREQMAIETKGNPGTLTELVRNLSPARLAGGFGLPDALRGSFGSWLGNDLVALPASTRLLLVAAAADPTGDPTLLWRAGERLGIAPDDAHPAIESGLLTIGARVGFRHPAIRSAVYRSSAPQDRQAVHQALARATVRDDDHDRRAWHHAHAATGPDEPAAAALELAAGQAQARGGLAAAAAFLEQAALLTPDQPRRSRRALTAAHVAAQAGDPDITVKLLDMVESDQVGEQARADTLRAVLLARSRVGDTPGLLLDAAGRLERLDASAARVAQREALATAITAGGLATAGNSTDDVSGALLRSSHGDAPTDRLVAGLAAWLGGQHASGVSSLRRALRHLGDEPGSADQVRWLSLACTAAVLTWDDRVWSRLSARWVAQSLESGALADLPEALSTLAVLLLSTGDLAGARSLVAEAEAVIAMTGVRAVTNAAVGLAALSPRPGADLEMIDGVAREAASRGEGRAVARANWAAAVLHNGSGHYEEAFAAAERAVQAAGTPSLAGGATAELIEAAARTKQAGRVTQAVRELSEVTTAAGTDWALGIQARSLALVSDDASADALYRTSIERLSRSRMPLDLARARLVYGEWLRRDNQRLAARGQLRQAHDLLTSMGVDGFAERARRELLATGEHSRKRTVEARGELTPQEMQIAVQARNGRTNAAIGHELFISPRTVEWHLRKVFVKLGITSRRQLASTLGDLTYE